MIQYDLSDAIHDLREYPADCRKLLVFENDLKALQTQINNFRIGSGILKVSGDRSHHGPDNRESDLLNLIEKEEQIRANYADLRRRMRLLSIVLASLQLDNKQIKALYLRCEYRCSFVAISGVLRVSPVEAWEMIRDIQKQFAENYLKIQRRKKEY